MAALNNVIINPCTFTFAPGVTNLTIDNTHNPSLPIGVYEPGVYCTIGAVTSAAVTLSGEGTYIFRVAGAFDMVLGTNVTVTNGASACNVFRTPIAATTFGANVNFIGTIIDNAGITIGANTTWMGRALSSASTINTTTDTITVPNCIAPTLNIITSVIGGTKVPANFTIHVNFSGGPDIAGSPAIGIGGIGTPYTLSAGTYTYVISENTDASYTPSFSAGCPGGNITLSAGDIKTCTITNTYIPPSSGGGGSSTLSMDSCPN